MTFSVLCAVILAAGLVLAFWLKREGERSWERHQQILRDARVREAYARVSKAFLDFQVALVDKLTPALIKVGREFARLEAEMRKGSTR